MKPWVLFFILFIVAAPLKTLSLLDCLRRGAQSRRVTPVQNNAPEAQHQGAGRRAPTVARGPRTASSDSSDDDENARPQRAARRPSLTVAARRPVARSESSDSDTSDSSYDSDAQPHRRVGGADIPLSATQRARYVYRLSQTPESFVDSKKDPFYQHGYVNRMNTNYAQQLETAGKITRKIRAKQRDVSTMLDKLSGIRRAIDDTTHPNTALRADYYTHRLTTKKMQLEGDRASAGDEMREMERQRDKQTAKDAAKENLKKARALAEAYAARSKPPTTSPKKPLQARGTAARREHLKDHFLPEQGK